MRYDVPRSWADARPLLRSVLRPATYASLCKTGEPPAWRQRFSSFVNELVVLDLPEAREIVTVQNTTQWGVGRQDVFAAGQENIARLHPPGSGAEAALRDAEHGSYLSSAILTPGWLAAFGRPGGPRPVAFVPTEDTLIIGTDDPQQGAKVFEMAEKIYCEAERPVSPEAFTVRAGRAVPFNEAGPHPLRGHAVRARTCAAIRQYREQTQFLTHKHQDDLVDVHVAAAQVIDAGHGMASIAVWGEGVVYDLPEVDYLFFINEHDHFAVPFCVVVDVVGILPAPGVFPRRYRVSGWPDPATMAALRFHAVLLQPC